VPAGQSGSIFGEGYGGQTFILTGGGTLTYQPDYVRGQLGGDWSAFTGTIIFQCYSLAGGFGLASDGAFTLTGTGTLNGCPNATIYMHTNNTFANISVSGGTGGAVYPVGALTGGDNTSFIGGGTQGNGSSGGAANTIWAIGSLNTSTTNGSQIVDGGCGLRKVGTGILALTNNVLSFGGQLCVSNGTLQLIPLGNNPGAFNALTNNYLVGTNITVCSPGVLDMSQAGGTLYLGHSSLNQTYWGNGTLIGNLVTMAGTNTLIGPGYRVSSGGVGPGKMTIQGNATINFPCTLAMNINRTNVLNSGVTNDSIVCTGGGTLTINSARLTVLNFGDTAFPAGSSNVFRFFNGPVTANAIGGAGTVGITNITVPALPAGMFWVTNLTVDGSMAIVNTNAGVTVNTSAFTMTNSFDGVNVTLSWPLDHTGYRLQAQTNTLATGLGTNWVDVAGASTTNKVVIPVSTGNGSVFYRLIYP
jgi:hypothetical protein